MLLRFVNSMRREAVPRLTGRRRRGHESIKLMLVEMLIEWTCHILKPHTNQLRVPEGICFWFLLLPCQNSR